MKARTRTSGWLAALPLLFTLLLPLAVPERSAAGEFLVRQCLGSGFQGFSGAYTHLGGFDRVDVVDGCRPGGATKIGIYQDRRNGSFDIGGGGNFVWTVNVGNQIVATQFDAKMKDANGISATLVGAYTGSNLVSLDDGRPHDGSQGISKWSNRNRPIDAAYVRLICNQGAGCANRPDSVKAFIEVFDVELTVLDSRSPTVSPSGQLWDWAGDSGFHRGGALLQARAIDQGGGLARNWLEVNDLEFPLPADDCVADRGSYATSIQVCPTSLDRTTYIETMRTPFVEGSNHIRFCAADYATVRTEANQHCSPTRTLRVDNRPPLPPIGLEPVEGSDWQATNSFSFRWRNPGDQVSPITQAGYRLLDPETGQELATGTETEPGIESLGSIAVPGPGEYLVELRLTDAAGNVGQPATTTIRFDDAPPGDVSPEPAAGWISRDELPLRQVVERADERGPSGVGGYALAVSSTGPVAPCPSGLCLGPELILNGGADDRTGTIEALAEGNHWISAVAASGAKVASLTPGSTLVKVDKTAPTVRISGLPSGWVNRPVTVTATATDADSGMVATPGLDDGDPITVIEADGQAAYQSPGATASFTVATEGVSSVRYWARDLAGNSNDGKPGPGGDRHSAPGEATIRVDTRPPRFSFVRKRLVDDPELVRAFAEDDASGIDSATVSWRRVGSTGQFTGMPTRRVEDGFEARIPSDDLPAGSYELRIEGSDRAGNTATGFRAEDGAPMLLALPLKQPVTVTAGLGKKGKVGVRVGYGKRPTVAGRLLDRAGRGIPGAKLSVRENFATGSRPASRWSHTVTDGTGRFRVKLKPGASRKVRVSYPGTRTRSRVRGRQLTIGVRGRTGFRVSPRKLRNGGWTRMTGRVGYRGALPPSRGKLVAIQYFDPSRSKWRPVEVLRTNRRGRFRYRYRFRTIATAQRIIFRAVVLAEAGWPYLPSTSGRRSVIVFPKGPRNR